MKYKITKLAVEIGMYEEEWTIEVIASVKWFVEKLVEKGYLIPIIENDK